MVKEIFIQIFSHLISWLKSVTLQRRRLHLDAKFKHIHKIKEKVINLLIEALERDILICEKCDHSQYPRPKISNFLLPEIISYSIEFETKFDEMYFFDLLVNHDPKLGELWSEYCKIRQRKEEEDKKFEKIISFETIRYMEEKNLPYSKESSSEDHYIISQITKGFCKFLYHIITAEIKGGLSKEVIKKYFPQTPYDYITYISKMFCVKIAEHRIYITNNHQMAKNAEKETYSLIIYLLKNSSIKEVLKEWIRTRILFDQLKNKLLEHLKKLSRMENLKLLKEWNWKNCQYI